MKSWLKIIVVGLGLFLILIFTSGDFRILISSPLRTEIQSNIKNLNIPHIKLQIPLKVIEKFDKIYSLYTGDYDSKDYADFLAELNTNNKWERTKLVFQNEAYNVKIKLHGKSPTQHFEGGNYSLGVKVLDGKKIKGVSRFNLIVYWRIRYKSDIIKYMADKLGIFYQEEELISVLINDRPIKLYFFEYRLNKGYFNKIGKEEFIALKLESDHSLIYQTGDIEEYYNNLDKAIKNDSLKTVIYNKYSQLADAIYNNDVEKTLTYFDIDYLARIQAFRYLYADNGHGFSPGNLTVVLDTSNFKFYPYIHRDNSEMLLSSSEINDEFNGNLLGYTSPLFILFSKSNLLATKTSDYLTKILREETVKSHEIDSIINKNHTYYYSSSIKVFLKLDNKHSSSTNIKSLRDFLLE